MQNASLQVQQHREKLKRDFWKEFLMYEDANGEDSPVKELPYPSEEDSAQSGEAEMIRVSQGGLISKIEVDVVIAEDVPDNGLAFDKIK